jgi:hypothetical protein
LEEFDMAKFLVLYLAPHAVVDEWMKTPPEKRKAEEEKMMIEWKKWTSEHASMFADPGAGAGKPKRVDANGVSDARNDIMLYAIMNADSLDAAAKTFRSHPHLGIPQSSIEVMELKSHGM